MLLDVRQRRLKNYPGITLAKKLYISNLDVQWAVCNAFMAPPFWGFGMVRARCHRLLHLLRMRRTCRIHAPPDEHTRQRPGWDGRILSFPIFGVAQEIPIYFSFWSFNTLFLCLQRFACRSQKCSGLLPLIFLSSWVTKSYPFEVYDRRETISFGYLI